MWGQGIGGTLSQATTLQIQGNNGTEVISFASGTTATQIANAINTSTQLTGVSAVVSGSQNAVIFTSNSFGSDAMVSVQVLEGTINLNSNNDTGADGTVTINGQNATVDGLNASVRAGALSLDLTMAQSFAQMTASGTTATFEITGGGAVFSIAPTLGLVGQETLGIQSVSTGSLGNGVIGYLSTLQRGETNDLNSKNFATAQQIVRQSVNQISSLRGRLGAFQKDTLQTTVNSLQVTYENTAAAESAIRDADFAVETSNLTRAQILVQAATATLQIANAQPQNVLALFG